MTLEDVAPQLADRLTAGCSGQCPMERWKKERKKVLGGVVYTEISTVQAISY